MQHCTNCGKEALPTDRFCLNCGFPVVTEGIARPFDLNLRERIQGEQGLGAPKTKFVRGLSRNAIVHLTQEGLFGTKIRSEALLSLALVLPLPLVMAAYYFVQAGALDVYVIAWITISGVLYDELKWRSLRRLEATTTGAPQTGRGSWSVRWSSVRMADWNGRTLWLSSTDPIRKISITFNHDDVPLVEQSLASWGVRHSWKPPRLPPTLSRFWVLALLLFVLGQAILISAATLPFFPGEEQMYNTVLNNTRSQFTNSTFIGQFRDIFFNNIQIAWGGMVPVLGQLSFGVASYNTGRVIQVIAVGAQIQPSVILASLYLLPHTWIEESAYPIATVAGLFAITKWRSVAPTEFSRRLNRGSTKLALSIVGVGLILLAADFIETAGLYLGFGEVLFWIPVGVGYYLYARWDKKRRLGHQPIGSA